MWRSSISDIPGPARLNCQDTSRLLRILSTHAYSKRAAGSDDPDSLVLMTSVIYFSRCSRCCRTVWNSQNAAACEWTQRELTLDIMFTARDQRPRGAQGAGWERAETQQRPRGPVGVRSWVGGEGRGREMKWGFWSPQDRRVSLVQCLIWCWSLRQYRGQQHVGNSNGGTEWVKEKWPLKAPPCCVYCFEF